MPPLRVEVELDEYEIAEKAYAEAEQKVFELHRASMEAKQQYRLAFERLARAITNLPDDLRAQAHAKHFGSQY